MEAHCHRVFPERWPSHKCFSVLLESELEFSLKCMPSMKETYMHCHSFKQQQPRKIYHFVCRYVRCTFGMQVVRARLGDDNRDCGYWGSARMVLETALCIATEVDH